MSMNIQQAVAPAETDPSLTEQSWIDAALLHIVIANFDDIRVEVLARELGVTKGSFYWHFRNRQHLLQRVLEDWMERATVRITRWSRSDSIAGVDRLARLLALPAEAPPDKHGAEIELAVRSWARREKIAAEMVERIDHMRLDNIVEIIAEMGFTDAEARQRASIAQSFMLGDSLLKTGLTHSERVTNARVCAELIVGPFGSNQP